MTRSEDIFVTSLTVTGGLLIVAGTMLLSVAVGLIVAGVLLLTGVGVLS